MTQHKQITELSEWLLEALSKITDEPARLHLLTQNELCSADGARQIIEAARTNLRIDPRRSLAFAEASIAIAESLKDEVILGPSLRAKANALHVLGDNQSALNFIEMALGIFRRQGNKEEEARTLNSSIQPCILLGNYGRALQAADLARDIFKQLGDTRRLAYVELNVGNLYHRQDRFEEALACYERAYDMFFPFADTEGLGVALYNISVCLISLNDFPRALASYRRARGMFATHGMSLLVGQADYNIAYLYYLRGEYGRAIAVLRKAYEQSEASGDAHIQALCHLDLSDIYLELNLSSQASESAREGLQRFRKLSMGYEEAKCLANEAIAWSQQNKPLRALELFAEARTIFVRENNLVWPSLIDLYSALAFFAEGRLFEARKSCNEALRFFETSSSPAKAVLCHLLLARIELQGGDSSTALKHVNEAMARLNGLKAPVLDYQAHYFKGMIHSAAGNEEQAYLSYQRARQPLETLLLKIRKEELKIPFVKEKAAVYERLIQVCLNREGDPSSLPEIFQYVELAKRRSLAEIILDEMHEVPKSIEGNSEMVRRIRELREELNWYDNRIEIAQLRSDRNNPAKIGQLESEARTLEEKLVQVLRELPASAPEARLFRPAEIAPVEKIQAALPPTVSLIEYFAVGEELLAALVTNKHLKILPVTLMTRVTNLVAKFRAELSRSHADADQSKDVENDHPWAILELLQNLYAELMEPLASHLSGEHIVVVPHTQLHCIPFHALFNGREYLIDRFAVSYAPTASVCVRRHDWASLSRDSTLLLNLGNESVGTFPKGAAEIAQAIHGCGLHLFTLSFEGDPASNSSRGLLAGEETQEALRRQTSTARWIHVAMEKGPTHDESVSRSRFRRPYLNLADLFQLQLQPEIASLSGFAPDLSLDAAVAGEELEALGKCLLEGGAGSVISALWEVPLPMITGFLRAFASSNIGDREASLPRIFQTSVQELRQQFPHPAHWAPFFLASSDLAN